jgi:sialate O-acetylesterase
MKTQSNPWISAGALLCACLLPVSLRADVKPNGLFVDHMVLQCDAPAPVWGTAAPGEKVIVEFAGQMKTATAGADGKWRVKLDPIPASDKPQSLVIRGKNTLSLKDVLVGEVWVASGQSNMASPLAAAHNAEQVIPEANDNQLRFFNVPHKTAAEPQGDLAGKWELTTPDTAKNFSAVAYFFAREIRKSTKHPVAVCCAPWGGTPVKTWMSVEAVRKDPPVTKTLDEWQKALDEYHKVQANPQLVSDYEKDLKQWQTEVQPGFNAAMKDYNAAKAAGKTVGPKPVPSRPEPENPDPMAIPGPSKRPHTLGVSFNGMIAPMIPYGIRGVIWYQGEDDGSRGLEYRVLFPRLIEDWRSRWEEGDFPFLFVQLPSCGIDSTPVAESGWPWTREAQFMTLKEPRTGMAITIDVGDPANVHPKDKVDVGQRLSLLARKLAYGETVVASGPLYKDCTVEGKNIRLRFEETGSGLVIGQAPWRAQGVEPLPTDKLAGFFIAGEDKNWIEATAVIDSDSVVVSSPQVATPVAVRYGWASSPRCNLYNKEGLPASPFRTDDWPK